MKLLKNFIVRKHLSLAVKRLRSIRLDLGLEVTRHSSLTEIKPSATYNLLGAIEVDVEAADRSWLWAWTLVEFARAYHKEQGVIPRQQLLELVSAWNQDHKVLILAEPAYAKIFSHFAVKPGTVLLPNVFKEIHRILVISSIEELPDNGFLGWNPVYCVGGTHRFQNLLPILGRIRRDF